MLKDIAARRAGFLAVGWGMLAAASLIAAVLMHHLGLSVTARQVWLAGAVAALLLAIAQFYAWRDRDARICALADTCAYLLCTTVVLIVTSYVAAACGGSALWDDAIGRADRLLGFDWLAHFDTLKSRPTLLLALGYIYNSFLVQPLAIIFVLALTGQLARLRVFVLLFSACGLAVVVLSGVVPALGAFAHYLPGTRLAAVVHGHGVGPEHLTELLGLRDGSLKLIDLANAQGLVSFPSFHAAASVLFAWALARTRHLAVPALILNALVIISTLSIGGHYLTDVIAGAALAGLAVLVAAGRSAQAAAARPAEPAMASPASG